MSRKYIYNKVSTKQRLTLLGLLFLCIAGNMKAQEAPLYVIKMEGQNYYLSHSGSGSSATLPNATTFSPNCLWYSGPNVEYNYYFIDEAGNYRYLSAPLELNGELYLTPTHPGTGVLNMASSGQYFYDWDHGVARGEEITGTVTPEECENTYHGSNGTGSQCWKVVWVSYELYEGNMRWQMSSEYGYEPTTYSARFKSVTKTEHPIEILETPAPMGGLPTIADFAMTYSADPLATHALDGTATPFSCTYRPAYTAYVFEGGTHNYYDDTDHGTDIPGTSTLSDATPVSYAWTLTGEGAQYLSLSANNVPNPTLTYHTENTTTSHKMATLTLTATYEGGVKEVRTVTVTVKAQCQNPIQASAPVVTYSDVTLLWVPTAEQYKLQWKASGADWSSATEVTDITANSYTITGSDFTALGYGQAYDYRVSAYCNSGYLDYPEDANLIYHFSTFAEPGLFIFGSVYGGGRMANVNGNTEVVVIDCDSVKAVYGGNDIAGTVSGRATITLGANANDANATAYNNGNASTKVRVFDVYGGGNGYYAYNGTSFEAASSDYYQQTVAVGGEVKAMTQTNQVGDVVWTNTGTSSVTLEFPKISQSRIVMTNDVVRVDSLFGGAKNAFLTYDDWHYAGDSIAIKGGTTYALFGGNNIGGGQGKGKHHIEVNNTKVNPTATSGFGRCFGIGYLFGGGNKVFGSTTEIFITGGQCDTVFAGGNSASVYAANVTVNCQMDAGSGSTFGNVYTNAITGYTAGTPPTLTMNDSYAWDGTGVYNVRTLFGGNNKAMMTCLPTVTLTSGSVGTVYGGGNAGNMMAKTTGGTIHFDSSLNMYDFTFDYSTKVVMNSATMLVDNLYGGCQMSDVGYSTWVQVQDGHVGTVYGGCNISGDVGSTCQYLDADHNNSDGRYQEVYGTTNVEVSGGTVHKDVFAGSNGFYHCLDAYGISYVEGITYDPAGHSYVGMNVPTHNETHVVVSGSAVINNNVYAGGNMAPVGFTAAYINHTPYAYPEFVGLASVRMIGGEVKGSVYGGGRMASITGNNEVRVTGGKIGTGPNGGALYGGNDRLGKAGGISNRFLPSSFNTASDHITPLLSGSSSERVNTYVSVTGNPLINTVYGGGNGAYKYSGTGADMQYCDTTDLPIQSNIFVDIAIDGNNGTNGAGYINNVFGGGNGVRAQGFIKVFLNVQNIDGDTQNHVGTIYGGNNMGDMENIVPEIILLRGNVGTVYGGCNSGAMAAVDGNTKSITVDGTTYENIGSYVHLLSSYDGDGDGGSEPVTPTAKVTGAVYGGCRMNGVTSNSIVILEGGNHSGANIFGGSDISGDVSGISYVVINGSYDSGTSTYNGIVNEAYGGGNGNYNYDTGPYEGLTPPYCRDSRVIMLDGQVANLYAGGYAGECGATTMTVDNGLVTGSVFGGGNEAGSTTSYDLTTTTFDDNHVSHTSTTTVTTTGNSSVAVNGGSINTGVYGGCNSSGTIAGNIVVDVLGGTIGVSGTPANIHGGGYGEATTTDGDVQVNIGATDGAATPTYSGTAVIWGDVYGGSALGEVSASDKVTNVNFYKGTINGDVYGGGLGDETHAAAVSGDVLVNVYGGVFNGANGTPGRGNIYGCNNANGSPMGDVNVNIYATDHGADYEHNLYPSAPPSPYTEWNVTSLASNAEAQTYAINAVFGGGNLAAYQPAAVGEGEDPHSATVHVYNCDNTIKDVFGGGNAADVGIGTSSSSGSTITRRADTYIYIEGGRIHRVIGGGNGEDLLKPAANIFGTANTTVYAGLIDEVYGGANRQGDVDAINLTMSNPSNSSLTNSCNHQVYGKVFGCANAADYNRSVTTNILCGVGEIGELYGGSNLAHIGRSDSNTAHVTLNIYGGTHAQVFAGSKGDLESLPGTGHTDQPSNIYGDVTLNLFGGIITDAYGGSNFNGNIAGTITVNVLDVEDPDCTSEALDLTNVYGASNMADYAPTFTPSSGTERISPVVNVIHIAQADGIRGNVYGGGNQASVTANPKVNIGYHHATMKQYIPLDANGDSLYHVPSTPRAYVKGNVFGGGNQAAVTGTDTVNLWRSNSYVNNVFGGGNQAGTTNTVVNVYDGTVNTNVYGGCNTSGTVTGDIKVDLLGGTVTQDVFGGGLGNATQTSGGILVTVDGSTVGRDVYGGSAFGQVNDNTDDLTKVWLKSGTVGGNLYGGGMGQAGTADWGQLNGKVEVLVNGGTVTGSVFGCNNYNEQPAGTVKVYINETTPGTMSIGGNVYGGGNVAYYDGTPEVYIQNGTVTHKVFGGGNNISTDDKGVGGSNVQMTGGTVLGGIFGGCNTDGDVEGDSHVTLINGTIGSTSARASIHGGGYGESTGVLGNVTVDFGQESTSHNDGLILYGDLYGGSALGNVNSSASNITTTVNVLNGIIQGIGDDPANTGYYGNVFGGGLGDESHPAAVNGVVHVNIGTETANGLASLVRCNVYGCNNQKGSPQDNVYVDVWGTTHTTTDEVDYYDFDRTYAIYQVFGGGNQAHYHAANNGGFLKRTHVTVHNCDNTIRYVYGGGNAADADGVETIILGGRFEEIYGGGNGRVTPANITGGGIGLNVVAGNVNFLFEGSNKEGENVGGHWYKPAASSDCLGGLFVDSYFFGTNEAELYGDLTNMINCADAGDFEYRYVYAGSRWGIVYGDINLMVGGGTIENLFGGCRGYSDYSADVRRFPTFEEITTDYNAHTSDTTQRKYSYALRQHMGYIDPGKPGSPGTQPEYAGHGGNINLVVTGGTIGNIFGGCDVKGNVEGNISVTVSEIDNACPLFVGNVYGASNQWYYNPEHSDINSPMVKILKGTIGGTHPDLPVNNIYGAPATEYEGNVFGGGNQGDVTSQPRVIIGDGTTGATATPVTVKGNVYGGGNRGDITGSPQVVVVPVRHTLTYSDGSGGFISVTDSQYQSVSSGDEIGEGIDVSIIATPDDYAHTFTAWAVSNGDAIIAEPTASSTTLTMGMGNSTITASFASASAYTLSWSAPTGGTFTVTGFKGIVNNGDNVAPGVTFTLAATPDMMHKFKQWTVTGGASVASTQSATTTFTMGSANATITAVFETVATHILTFTSTTGGSCTVTGVTSGANIGEGAVLNIVATASSGYAFSNWTVEGSGSVANPTSPSTTFTMGTADATLTAHFVPTHALTINAPTNGTIRVTTGLGQEVNTGAAVGEGAKLNLKATPATGYAFDKWTITGTGASVENDVLIRPITTFTMGTENSSISASFITAHTLTVEEPVNGTVKLTGVLNQNMSSPANIGEDVVISIQAIHDEGYVFNKWEVVSGNGTIGNATEASTTFTMRTQNTIIRAIFVAQ